MEDNTKKIMLVSTILGTLAAATFGYKYYYEPSPQKEDKSTVEVVKKYKTLENKLPNGERTKERTSFLTSFTQTIGFGYSSNKNPEENTTKKEVALELQEKKQQSDDEEKTWPTFN